MSVLSQFLWYLFLRQAYRKRWRRLPVWAERLSSLLPSPPIVSSLIYQFVLQPLGMDYLKTIVFILIIAALVQIVEMFLKKCMVSLYNALGVFLPLITTNCAVLGVALTNVQNGYGFVQSVVNGIGTAVGYTISIVLLAGIREHIEGNDVPYSFQGSPIVLVTAGLMAIAFFGFSGLL